MKKNILLLLFALAGVLPCAAQSELTSTTEGDTTWYLVTTPVLDNAYLTGGANSAAIQSSVTGTAEDDQLWCLCPIDGKESINLYCRGTQTYFRGSIPSGDYYLGRTNAPTTGLIFAYDDRYRLYTLEDPSGNYVTQCSSSASYQLTKGTSVTAGSYFLFLEVDPSADNSLEIARLSYLSDVYSIIPDDVDEEVQAVLYLALESIYAATTEEAMAEAAETAVNTFADWEGELQARFDFSSTSDVSGTYNGSLCNGAELITMGDCNVLSLGSDDGYFDLGSDLGNVVGSLEDFTVSVNVYIPSSTSLSGNGNFVWTFANSTASGTDANGYAFFRANDTHYAISLTLWSAESTLESGDAVPQDEWTNLTFAQEDGTAKIYVNAELVAEGTFSLSLSNLGATPYNFLGRSSYAGDAYLTNAYYSDFRLYSGALSRGPINALCKQLPELEAAYNEYVIEQVIASLDIPAETRENLVLPSTQGDGVSIVWASSDEDHLTSSGQVIRPAEGDDDVEVTLTATLTRGDVTVEQAYTIVIKAKVDDAASVRLDVEDLALEDADNVYDSIYLPAETVEGSIVLWTSSNPEVMTNEGKVVKLGTAGEGKTEVTMTATVIKGEKEATRDFTVYVAEDEGYSAYLFAYFTGNTQSAEQIRFAVSLDGYNYTPLNDGDPVIASDTIALKKAVRDPHILRGEDGKTFYMVATDMKSSDGWSSNDGIVLLKSTDLINWEHTTIDFPAVWPDRFDRTALTQVWAPQTIYDPDEGKYMVYYSIGETTADYYIIYYSYANDDFTELTEPAILYDHGANTIDGDIVLKDSTYHIFFKTESDGNGIQKATSSSLFGPWTANHQDLQQTTAAVEGSGVFKLINSNSWVLMYDCYNNGYYQFCSSTDLENFTLVCSTTTSGTFTPRHGTVIPITQEEAERLVAAFPSSALTNTPQGASNPLVRTDYMEINTSDNTIYLPVEYDADLTSFDPQLYGMPGAVVTPEGAQDFSNGAVTYTFSMNGSEVTYEVKAEICVNPIIPGFHADPEVMFSAKTGRFYIYPTTDGLSGWSGSYFNAFSSADLVHWVDEGTILDLASDDVSWASGNAWAPAMQEVEDANGNYNYYFYFSGNDGSAKSIGVAVSNSPFNSFVDSGAPIVNTSPTGSGQQIDVDVFIDPVSGKPYLYWGNGYMAGAELAEDMLSIVDGTTVVMTPSGGSTSTYAYREAPYVFYREGTYYFLWSVDDTGSTNYHVAYGTSDSPLGTITVADDPIVLIQDSDNEIYGTAHNSIIQIPGTDEWYIVYHRINKNYLSDGPGYHREVCIDHLYFNEDGTIQSVTPTHRGIDPVTVSRDVLTGISEKTTTTEAVTSHAVARVVYYSLNGYVLGEDASKLPKGAYIRLAIYTDGSTKGETYLKP